MKKKIIIGTRKSKLAVIYAKPRGLPLANTYVEEITQETWPVFPWDEEDKANH